MGQVLFDEREAAGLSRLERLAAREAALFAETARQLHDSAVLSERLQGAAGADRFLVLELAGTLRCGQVAAGHRLAEAQRLVQVLPHTLRALEAGDLYLPQARLVLELTRPCSDPVAAAVDERLHRGPDGPVDLSAWSARRLRERLRRLVLRTQAELEPEQVAEAERTAREGRRVSVRPEPDGMGSLWALLPAEQLRAFTAGLDELHRRQLAADRDAGVERTADQRRADVLARLPALALHALDGTSPGTAPGGTAFAATVVLNVHVPVATVLGLADAPAVLDGHGPISAEHVRRLLPSARLRRVLVDEDTGEPLHVQARLHPPVPARTGGDASGSMAPAPAGTGAAAESKGTATSSSAAAGSADRARLLGLLPGGPVLISDAPEPQYEPSAGLARLVRLRDPICTGPGCSVSSGRSDLDHEVPWPYGPTSAGNLRPRSRRCHRAKTFSWTVAREPDGTHRWTGPSGRRYAVPPSWSPPPQVRDPRPTDARPTDARPAAVDVQHLDVDQVLDLLTGLEAPARPPLPAVPARTTWPVDAPF